MANNTIKGTYWDENGVITDGDAMSASTAEINAGESATQIVTPRYLIDSVYIRGHVGTTAPADTSLIWFKIP